MPRSSTRFNDEYWGSRNPFGKPCRYIYNLTAVGLPVEAIGVIWVTDRVLDMCRTSVNVYSDTVAAVVIAESEGERSSTPIEA